MNRTSARWLGLLFALALMTPVAFTVGLPAADATSLSTVADKVLSKAPQTDVGATTNARPLSAPSWTELPVTSKSHPFGGDAWLNRGLGLAKRKYVEKEYLVSGKARVYGPLANTDYGTAVKGESRYTTRAIVRRPANMHSWSGNVVVEYMNATDNVDLQILWSKLADKITSSGDVYVGFTGKPNVIPILRQFDPQRYGAIDMPNPLPPDEQTCGKLPDEPGYDPNESKLFENGLLWDMWSQIGLSFKSSVSPLGRTARDVFAYGESQSGAALQNYYRWFGGNRTLVKGKPVYDGMFDETSVTKFGGPFRLGGLNQCAAPLPADDRQVDAAALPNRGTPYFAVHSQFDAWPKTPPGSKFYRNWDIAGADHVDREMYDHIYPVAADLIKGRAVGPDAFPWMQGTTPEMYSPSYWFCDDSTIPEVPFPAAQRMAYTWFKRWVINGVKPPVLPYLKRNGASDLVLDEDGNALGGLRLPEIAVPIASYSPGFGDCSSAHTAFTSARLAELYPSHADYVNKISAAAKKLVKAKLISSADADAIISRAKDRPIP